MESNCQITPQDMKCRSHKGKRKNIKSSTGIFVVIITGKTVFFIPKNHDGYLQ